MPLVDDGQLYKRFEPTDPRLGRHYLADARSLRFMVENSAAAMAGKLTDQHWDRSIPILDQGHLGSCTGNAGTGALGTAPYWEQIGAELGLDEDYAIKLYSDATRADIWPGEYPPEDTGSSGLAVCKVLKARTTISRYVWARSAYGFLRLLQRGPVLFGMPWYRAFYEPDRDGFIDSAPNWPSSGLAGGHEVEPLGCELAKDDLGQTVLEIPNSWSTSWGDGGYFRMRLSTYERLPWTDLKQIIV